MHYCLHQVDGTGHVEGLTISCHLEATNNVFELKHITPKHCMQTTFFPSLGVQGALLNRRSPEAHLWVTLACRRIAGLAGSTRLAKTQICMHKQSHLQQTLQNQPSHPTLKKCRFMTSYNCMLL
jgi:hypothetical protein